MATVTITDFMPAGQYLGNISGDDSGSPTLITTTSTTSFEFLVASSGNFANWSVSVTGTGFRYLLNDTTGVLEPTSGLISSIVFKDDLGNVALTIDSFPSSQRMELVELYYALFETPSQVNPNLYDFFTQVLNFNDVINGSEQDDDIPAGRNTGNDTIFGNGGNDYIKGDAGNDTMDGGSGRDTLTYSESFWDATAYRGINLNVTTGIVKDCWGGTDTVSGFENYQGSRFKDVMVGSNDREVFMGLRGADTIDGGGDNAVSNGGRDWARYDRDAEWGGTRGIIVKLELSFVGGVVEGTIRDGFGQLDVVRNIERVVGTMKNDSFTGSFLNNVFEGLGGKDSYDGLGGSDRIDFYNIDQWGAVHGVEVNLALASNQVRNDGFDFVENALSIENVGGSSFNDTMSGSDAGNYFEGAGGADILRGRGGADGFGYYGLNEFGDKILDFATGVDTIYFGVPNIEGLDGTLRFNTGSAANQSGPSFYFNAADRTLYYDQDGNGGSFDGIAVFSVQAGGSVAAGDIILEV